MQAAGTLDGLYARNEAQIEREMVRRDARERAALAIVPAQTAAVPLVIPLTEEEQRLEAEETKERDAAAVWASVSGKGKGGAE